MSPQRKPAIVRSPQLAREEYIEQAHLYKILRERTGEQVPIQDLLEQVHFELLATTKLPYAIDYLLTEVKHSGLMAPAMIRMSHYFTPFQAYLIQESEQETGRFTIGTALQVLEADAKYRLEDAQPTGMFFFQFEVLCRNRLNYDKGLWAISNDPLFDESWAKWILHLRAQVGLVDLADLLFLASQDYRDQLIAAGHSAAGKGPFLFGKKEGRIAFANRGKDPLYLFAAMQRHLGYPAVPRLQPADPNRDLIPQVLRRLERLETRIKLMEQEQRAGMDITRFYEKQKVKGDLKLPELPE